ncbi:MAG: PAS domain S-box protein [Actinobacteria bacterium]|nr:PAS domain S-box protein [Actinomycetota bacterium]MCL5882876.1 PAS domain S-box protein [Actinomycetota bacterium]
MTETNEVKQEEIYLLAAIVQSSDDAIIGKTLDGIITSWNKGAEKLYGYSEKEVVGKSIGILVPPGHEDELPAFVEEVKDGKSLHHYETERKKKDGTIIDVSLALSAIRNADGEIAGISTIARGITPLKQAAQYARSLIEASLDPLVTISPEGKITDVNEATIKVTGVPREELIGTDFSNYFTEPDKAREGYMRVFSEGSVTDYPLTIRHISGNLADVLYNASVFKDVQGNVLGVFAAARDVTAQKRQAEAQVAAQRKKELDRLAELERFQKLTVGRELKMIELKKELEELKRQSRERGQV